MNEREEEKCIMWTSVITAPQIREGILDLNFPCAVVEINTCKGNSLCKMQTGLEYKNMHTKIFKA